MRVLSVGCRWSFDFSRFCFRSVDLWDVFYLLFASEVLVAFLLVVSRVFSIVFYKDGCLDFVC